MYNGQPGRVRADADLLTPQFHLCVSRRARSTLQAVRRRLRRPVQGRRRQRPPTQGLETVRQPRRTPRQGRRQVSSHSFHTFLLCTFRSTLMSRPLCVCMSVRSHNLKATR